MKGKGLYMKIIKYEMVRVFGTKKEADFHKQKEEVKKDHKL